MKAESMQTPEGFEPHFRKSGLTDPWEPLYSSCSPRLWYFSKILHNMLIDFIPTVVRKCSLFLSIEFFESRLDSVLVSGTRPSS